MLYPDLNDLVRFGDLKVHLMHPSCRSVKSKMSGGHRSSFRGQGLEFDSVREYVPGDDIRNIDWRVTARTGSPHLKIFKEERERSVVICVDMNATMRFGTRNTFKSVQAARIAALLGWSAIASQDRVSACFFGDIPEGIQFFGPKRTGKSFCSLLKVLATPPLENHLVSLTDALLLLNRTVHAGSLVYVISDFMEIDENFQKERILSQLSQKCDVIFVGVNDPSDRSIFPLENIGFQLNPFEKIYVNTESLAARKMYEALWDKHQEKLQEITSKFKIPLIELTTESDVHRELTLNLKKISRRKKL